MQLPTDDIPLTQTDKKTLNQCHFEQTSFAGSFFPQTLGILSYEVTTLSPRSDIIVLTPCIIIDKPLVVYRFW